MHLRIISVRIPELFCAEPPSDMKSSIRGISSVSQAIAYFMTSAMPSAKSSSLRLFSRRGSAITRSG